MRITTNKFDQLHDLGNQELETYQQEINPMWTQWPEYTNLITDYQRLPVAVTHRSIQPYITSQTHGDKVWEGLVELVQDLKPHSIVDLGCGAGEFFTKLPDDIAKYGLTIHTGEVKYAREKYGLDNIIPADMREVEKYFHHDSVDMVLAHHSFDFISPKERIETMVGAWLILKPGKHFIYVDDERFAQSQMPTDWEKYTTEYKLESYFKIIEPKKSYFAKGKITILQKYV